MEIYSFVCSFVMFDYFIGESVDLFVGKAFTVDAPESILIASNFDIYLRISN